MAERDKPRDEERRDRRDDHRPRGQRPPYDRTKPRRSYDHGPGPRKPYDKSARPSDRPLREEGPGSDARGDRPPSHAQQRPPGQGRSYQPRRYPPRHCEPRPPGRRLPGGRPPGGRPPGAYPRRHEPEIDRSELLAEDHELIAGRRPVEEAFAARRDAVRLLIVPERRQALDALAIHATTLRIPVVEVEGGTLTALAGFDGHQGVALVSRPRPSGDIDAILARARERGQAPFVLVLDSLEDPQNFGTLLRSAEACGVHGVIYPTRRAAPLSPAAIKASAGATEHLVLAPVDDLAGSLADLHADGLRIVGADESASLDYSEADLRGPLAIVVGSEGRGISGSVRRRLDLSVRIPMRGKIASLNAAVAGSILLFGAAAQRPFVAQPPMKTRPEPATPAVEGADERSPAEPATPDPVEDLLPDD